MKKKFGWNQRIMLVLIVLSVLFAVIQLVLFHDTKESVFLFLQDLIFLPINILLVTFILDRIIQTREKQEKLDHMNIVIGAFFGEIGNDFLRLISQNIAEIDQIRQLVDMNADWSDRQFDRAAATVTSLSFTVVASNEYLQSLKQRLPADRMQLTRLFENPNLLEHDSFTDTLWSVYHLIDELESRADICTLPETDVRHISGDIVRAYSHLLYEWIYYMKHLKNKYPYLWSLAVRNNPFSEDPQIIVNE
ncbi:MAG: hypothetical protein ACC608_12610 [Anaerofustis sp.]